MRQREKGRGGAAAREEEEAGRARERRLGVTTRSSTQEIKYWLVLHPPQRQEGHGSICRILCGSLGDGTDGVIVKHGWEEDIAISFHGGIEYR